MKLDLLKRLVAVDSTTNTAKEADMAKELCAVIGEDPWFKEHPDLFGMIDIPDPDDCRIADVDGASVYFGEGCGDGDSLYDLLRRNRTHGHDHFT